MKHILIIGGTGMLKEASVYFAKNNVVSVVARPSSNKLKKLNELSKNINPIEVDYINYDDLKNKIILAIKKFGKISVAIVWIHDYAEEANKVLVEILGKSCKYYHIFGYAGLSEKIDSKLSNSVDYRKIVLGQIEGRWLTNQEISAGVIKAVEENEKECLVGNKK